MSHAVREGTPWSREALAEPPDLLSLLGEGLETEVTANDVEADFFQTVFHETPQTRVTEKSEAERVTVSESLFQSNDSRDVKDAPSGGGHVSQQDMDRDSSAVGEEDAGVLDEHVSMFLGLKEQSFVPSMEWSPLPSTKEISMQKKKIRRPIGGKDKTRSTILNCISDLLDYCLRKRHVSDSAVKVSGVADAVAPCADALRSYERLVLSRCTTPAQTVLLETLLQSGDPCLAFSDIPSLIAIFSPVSVERSLGLLVPSVERLLSQYCTAAGFPSSRKRQRTAHAPTCKHCGSEHLVDQPDGSLVCEECGLDIESCAWEDTVNMYQEGRQFVDSEGLFQHLAATPFARHRLRVSVMACIRNVCKAVGLQGDTALESVAQLLSRYALNSVTARKPATIAACAFLILRRQGDLVTISQVATRVGVHTMTLASYVFRVCIALGLAEFPTSPPMKAVTLAVRRVLEAVEEEERPADEKKIEEQQQQHDTIVCRNYHEELQTLSALPTKACTEDLSVWLNESHQESVFVEKQISVSESLLDDILGDIPEPRCDALCLNDTTDLFETMTEEHTASAEHKQCRPVKRRRCKGLSVSREEIAHLAERLVVVMRKGLTTPAKPSQELSSVTLRNGTALLTKRLQKLQVEAFPSSWLYDAASSVYFASLYWGEAVPSEVIAHALCLNHTTFYRYRSRFLRTLQTILISTGLTDGTTFQGRSQQHKVKAVIELIELNYALLHDGNDDDALSPRCATTANLPVKSLGVELEDVRHPLTPF